MVLNDLRIQRGISFVFALGARDFRLGADAWLPLIQTDGPVPGCPFALIFPPLGIDIITAFEKGAEQTYLGDSIRMAAYCGKA